MKQRSIKWMNEFLSGKGENPVKIWEDIGNIINKTLLSGLPYVRHAYNMMPAVHERGMERDTAGAGMCEGMLGYAGVRGYEGMPGYEGMLGYEGMPGVRGYAGGTRVYRGTRVRGYAGGTRVCRGYEGMPGVRGYAGYEVCSSFLNPARKK